MALEEHNQRYSNSSSGGGGGGGGGGDRSNGGCGGSNRSSKKLKQKKIPQRGLGVAQLEKIRLEEQQKKDATISSSSSSSLALLPGSTNFRHNSSPSSSIPPHFPLSPPNSVFRPPPSIPNVDLLNPNPVGFPNPSNGGGGEVGWPGIPGLGKGNFPKFWNRDFNFEGENHRLDHHGFAFRSNMSSSYESNPIWPPPNLIQNAHQFQQQQPPSSPSSMVNVPSGTSSSSAINYPHMEPPSNQSFYGNNYTPMWPEEEKMVGMKRPYPFSMDNPPGPSFSRKFPPTYLPPIARADESASFSSRGTINVESINPVFREGPSSSAVIYELNSNEVIEESGNLNGDFLTLAPPTRALPHSSSEFNHLSAFESPPYQGIAEDTIHQTWRSGSAPKQALFSFFPSEKSRIGQPTAALGSCNGGGDKLDLDLKL